MSNSLSLLQFKEEYQKLMQQAAKINKDTENLLQQKVSEVTPTIVELKEMNFTFTHPNNHNLQTKHGAIMGIDENYLYVYCANGNPVLHRVNKITGLIDNNLPTTLLCDFVHFCDVAFALNGLESLDEQMRNCLTSLEERNKQRRQMLDTRLNSNS